MKQYCVLISVILTIIEISAVRKDPTMERFDSERRRGGILAPIIENAKCKATEIGGNIKLQDENFVRKQLDCILDQGPCDKIGTTLKSKLS